MITLAQIGERSLIEHLRRRVAAGPGVVIGLGDDAAAVSTGPLTLLTTDAFVEDVHFRLRTSAAEDIGWKALGANVSDVGAMGGVPRYASVSLCLRPQIEVDFVDRLYDGILAAAGRFAVSIVGGNVSSIDGPLVVDMVLLGDAPEGRAVRRSTAQPGDLIVVTGSLGAAAAGLFALERGLAIPGHDGAVEACRRAQRRPLPPFAFAGRAASRGLIAAAIDLSDGLAADLTTLCSESRCGARIDTGRLPIAEATRIVAAAVGADPVHLACQGGEDYELLLAIRPQHWEALAAAAEGTALTPIGVITERPGLDITGDPSAFERSGFDHFAKRRANVR